MVKWDLDTSKLLKMHTGSWSVEIKSDNKTDEIPLLTFELIIMAGCKGFYSNPTTNKYIWPSTDVKWASLKQANAYSIKSSVSWLSDEECQKMANQI